MRLSERRASINVGRRRAENGVIRFAHKGALQGMKPLRLHVGHSPPHNRTDLAEDIRDRAVAMHHGP